MSARARTWAVIILASIGGTTLTVGGFYVTEALYQQRKRRAATHRRTDPACVHFTAPSSRWARWRFDLNRGRLCRVCS